MDALERALAIHEQWLASGRALPATELLARHPDLVEWLRAMLADPRELDRKVAEADGGEGDANA
jgi:putative ubiquitin-RnfH superfamily antitoxin RatB of RatAB toxin-antitoxin module